MKKNPLFLVGGVAVALVAGLAVLRNAPQTPTGVPQNNNTTNNEPAKVSSAPKELLKVGFLPVTCHLTCPVTDFSTRTSTENRFESERFTAWPDVAEAIKAGRLKATFMIAPLAMKLREQGLPIKIVYLGHRDGSTVMVRTEDTAKSLKDLKGKSFAVPSFASNQYLVIRKLMEDQGLQEGDINFKQMAPPDMPVALQSKAIDAYFVGEPHCAKAEVDGFGRVLYHAKDIWPHFISCVLVVSEDLIKEKPAVVKDLVRGIAESGEWAETHRDEAGQVAQSYFKQPYKYIHFTLTQPPDRVSYRMLTPTDEDMQAIADMALKTKVVEKPVDVKALVDRSFIPEKIEAAKIDMTGVTYK
jgi:NitT/TauT family transport system substrate-binding protein